jgi:hypothetical protein
MQQRPVTDEYEQCRDGDRLETQCQRAVAHALRCEQHENAAQHVAEADALQDTGNAYGVEIELGIQVQQESDDHQQQAAPQHVPDEIAARISAGRAPLE